MGVSTLLNHDRELNAAVLGVVTVSDGKVKYVIKKIKWLKLVDQVTLDPWLGV